MRGTLRCHHRGNEPFSSWAKIFARLCGAIVGRLAFAGQIIETTTSYRLARVRGQRSARPARQPADCQ